MSADRQGTGEMVIPSFCHGCGSYKPRCGLLCHVRDGRFVRVEGNPEAFNNGVLGSTSLCAKGLTGPQWVYAADRLKYPLKRVGAKGEGRFQRITWDEALDTIAGKLKEAKDRYGPESYGVLSPEYWPVLATLGRRLLNVHGSPNYMHSAICATPRMAASKITMGYVSMAPDDWRKTRLIVNWGANVENSGVNQGTPRAILDALQGGTKLLDIRPMLEPLGTKADLWLPIRPGTDCALALACTIWTSSASGATASRSWPRTCADTRPSGRRRSPVLRLRRSARRPGSSEPPTPLSSGWVTASATRPTTAPPPSARSV